MTVSRNASGAIAPVQARKASSRIAIAMCSVLAWVGNVAPTAWAAEPVESDQKAAADAREASERERKLNDARKRLDAAAREVAELSRAMSEDAIRPAMRMMSGQASRAMLGVNIGSGRGEDRKDGVEIVSVSPGGPAANAGLKAGDVIVEIRDKPLKEEGSRTPRDQLLTVMREVEPDEKVKVRYLRDGKVATATVVASRTDFMVRMPLRVPGPEHLPSFAFLRSHGVFGSAELVALTPKLGQYFGTDKGLLVVRAPADSRLQLEEGDVIVDIAGRVPTSASHALRIFGSYQPGEKLKLNVLRMKKRMTFDITIPEDAMEHRFDGAKIREFDDIPVPAVPAVPPTAPAPASSRNDTA